MNRYTESQLDKTSLQLLNALSSAGFLAFSWVLVTILHEFFHAASAMLMGYKISAGGIGIDFGSITVYGEMRPLATLIVAVSATLGLTMIAVFLIFSHDKKELHLIGVIFAARAWVDSLPVDSMDGMHTAGITGAFVAWLFAMVLLFVCGALVARVIK